MSAGRRDLIVNVSVSVGAVALFLVGLQFVLASRARSADVLVLADPARVGWTPRLQARLRARRPELTVAVTRPEELRSGGDTRVVLVAYGVTEADRALLAPGSDTLVAQWASLGRVAQWCAAQKVPLCGVVLLPPTLQPEHDRLAGLAREHGLEVLDLGAQSEDALAGLTAGWLAAPERVDAWAAP